jgi:hypothetical protein
MTFGSVFTGWVQDTGSNYQKGPGERLNHWARLNYDTLGFLTRGKKQSRVVKGGSDIREQIMLTGTARAENISATATTSPAITETGAILRQDWRILRTHCAYDERALDLNMGGNVGSDGGFQQFRDTRDSMYQEMYTDLANKMDENLWAQPHFDEMEGTSGIKPLSIPAIVNEHVGGLTTAACDAGGDLWTTLFNLLGTTTGFTTNFAPQRFSYTNVTVNSPTNLIAAFDLAYESLNFKAPPQNKEYFNPDSGMLPAQTWIAASKEGVVKLKQLCRASQDRWDNPLDAYGGRPTYAGVPVVSVALLTTATIFPTGSAGAAGTESTTTNSNGGPRFHLINSNYLDVLYHSKWFMHQYEIQRQQNNPARVAIFYDTLHNVWANSRKHHGIIYPTANIA